MSKYFYMKTRITIFSLTIALLLSSSIVALAPVPLDNRIPRVVRELVYVFDGSLYHAVERQCDDTPFITGSGFRIDPCNASRQRILAVSPDLLNDPYRLRLAMSKGYIKDTIQDTRFRGELCYGDSVWVESPKDSLGNYIYPNLNGWWYVEDAKNPRYRNSNIKLDFLQTVGDRELFNDDSMWCGKFEGVKIFKDKYNGTA